MTLSELWKEIRIAAEVHEIFGLSSGMIKNLEKKHYVIEFNPPCEVLGPFCPPVSGRTVYAPGGANVAFSRFAAIRYAADKESIARDLHGFRSSVPSLPME